MNTTDDAPIAISACHARASRLTAPLPVLAVFELALLEDASSALALLVSEVVANVVALVVVCTFVVVAIAEDEARLGVVTTLEEFDEKLGAATAREGSTRVPTPQGIAEPSG